MQEDPAKREIADKILAAMEKEYGFVPLVYQVLSTRPDLMIPMAGLGKEVFEGKGDLDPKTRYLCAVAAAAACGGEHCIGVQMKHAQAEGATRDEVLESIMIGTFIAMTRAQSYAFRKYDELYEVREKDRGQQR